jgi:hypothetical protein
MVRNGCQLQRIIQMKILRRVLALRYHELPADDRNHIQLHFLHGNRGVVPAYSSDSWVETEWFGTAKATEGLASPAWSAVV